VNNVTYALAGNVSYPTYNGIIVERNNIVIDGNDYTVQGTGASVSTAIDMSGRKNVTVKNTQIKNFWYGILLNSSSGNSISGNNITANNGTGISLYSSSNISISGNNIRNNGYGIWLDSSSSNSIRGNNVTANNNDGIHLSDSSNNTVSGNNATANSNAGIYLCSSSSNSITANNMANNRVGLQFSSSSNNSMCHNNSIGNSVQASVDATSFGNAWDDGYPAGGNYWSDCNGTDLYRGSYQNVTGSDGIGDEPYVIDANNTDYYPLMKLYAGPCDLGVTSVTTCKTGRLPMPTVGCGYDVNITTEIWNYGIYDETSGLAIYANATLVQPKINIALPARSSVITTIPWNTSGLAYGNYTIAAIVDAVPNETNTSRNTLTGDWIIVTIPGDVNGDLKVSLADLTILSNAYGSKLGDAEWNPNADIDNDGRVGLTDLTLLAGHYGKHFP
jgi:parallel beta-helix repeat protein